MSEITETLRDTMVVRDKGTTRPDQMGVWRFDLVEIKVAGFHIAGNPFEIRGERIEGPGTGARVSVKSRKTLGSARKALKHTAEAVCGWIKDGDLVIDLISHEDAKGNGTPVERWEG